MIPFNPLMPIHLVLIYFTISSAALVLCLMSLVGIYRTKRTPYATKILSMTLLTYDTITLLISSICRLFDYNDSYILWHMTRGFQIAAQIIVGCMSLERLFALNWPFVYLKVATRRNIRFVNIGIFIFSTLQYIGIRTAICYVKNKPINCGLAFSLYLLLVSLLVPSTSFISYIKIYKIIQKAGGRCHMAKTIRQYKGTAASFMFLINATIAQVIFLGLSALYLVRSSNGTKDNGLVGTLADWWGLINCIIDPLIFVIWFREARMEFLKLVSGICPSVNNKIEELRVEIYQIHVSAPPKTNTSKI